MTESQSSVIIQKCWRGFSGRKRVSWMRKKNEIILGCCIRGMKNLDADSVDIVIADPPYNIGKDFGNDSDKQSMDAYLLFCDEWMKEAFRILSKDRKVTIDHPF